jgi:D-3-phosphoglycerate dehydrogenase
MATNKHRIHITSKTFCNSPELIEKLHQLEYEPLLWDHQEALEVFLRDARWLILGTEKLHQDLIMRLEHLKGISKYGVGTDNIDFEALEKKNIKIALHPGTNRLAVAEYALGLLLSGLHQIFRTSQNLKNQVWDKNGGKNLSQKTIGIIGYGHVGQEFIRLLSPFHCNILVNEIDPKKIAEAPKQLRFETLETVLTHSDAVSLHIPLTDVSRSLINQATLALMKKDSILINTSRGEIVHHADMLAHLAGNKSFQYLADTHTPEPYDGEMLRFENFIGTPHSAGNSHEAIKLMGEAAIQGIDKLIKMR